MNYLAFTLENRRLLGFGLLLAFSSSFAQTLFIGLFGADIRQEFDLSHGDFGTLYSIATLFGAVAVIWLGRLIDRMSLRLYTLLLGGTLIGAFFLMAWTPSVAVLGIALCNLRTTGPTLRHAALTSMARFFSADRGKAVSIIWLGLPLGEAILPIAAVTLTAALGWRTTWAVLGVMLAVILLPASFWMLRSRSARDRPVEADAREHAGAVERQWSQREAMHDPRFWRIMPTMLGEAFIVVALFLHQAHLAASKGWSVTWIAGSFVAFAVTTVASTLMAGSLIDRIGAVRMLPFYNLPLALGLLLLALWDHPLIAPLYMILAGICTGANRSVTSALWPELYGSMHLGAIRSMFLSIFMLATAIAPAVAGWLFDFGVSVEAVALMGVAYIAAATALIVAMPIAHGRANSS